MPRSDQAYLIAQYSFALPRNSRADLLDQISRAYRTFNVANLADEASQKAADSATLTTENAVNISRRPFRIQPTAPPDKPDLDAKVEERVALRVNCLMR